MAVFSVSGGCHFSPGRFAVFCSAESCASRRKMMKIQCWVKSCGSGVLLWFPSWTKVLGTCGAEGKANLLMFTNECYILNCISLNICFTYWVFISNTVYEPTESKWRNFWALFSVSKTIVGKGRCTAMCLQNTVNSCTLIDHLIM